MYPNQYPNQPYNTQPQTLPKKSSATKIIFILMITTGFCLFISVGVWIFCASKSSSDNGKTPNEMAALLDTKNSAPLNQEVKSNLGVSVKYNSRELMAFGFADGSTFSGDDLDEKRDYGVIRIRPVETNQAARDEITLVSPELRITSTSDKKYWEKLLGKEGYKNLPKIDALIKSNNEQRSSDNRSIEISSSKDINFKDFKYKKVSYTNKDERYGVTSLRREDCYFTIQNDRPYIVCIDNIRAVNFSVASQLEQVLMNISYSKPSEDSIVDKADDSDNNTMTDSKKESIAKSDVDTVKSDNKNKKDNKTISNNISSYLSSTSSFRNFASVVPSVVRTGMLYCADIKLTLPDGKIGTQLTGACVEKAGSGFFISSDGMIATAASNINVTPREAIRAYITNPSNVEQASERLGRILQYMLESKLLMQTDVDAINSGLSERNQDIIEKIYMLADMIDNDKISLEREKYSYAVQTSDKPIAINRKNNGSLEFNYSDNVLEAEMISKKYDAEKSQTDIFKGDNLKNDVSILKLKKTGSYPAVLLAGSSTVPKDSLVGIIGMPMYSSGSILTGQLRSTAMFKQGEAKQTFAGGDAQRLLVLNSPLHSGMAGSLAINSEGRAIGVASYNTAQCPNGDCISGSVIRDISEVKLIVKDNNKVINNSSVVSDLWNNALNELIRGNYKKATDQFISVSRQYPQNYLAKSFADFSKSQIGKDTDTSGMNIGVSISRLVTIISAIFLLLLIIIRLFIRLFIRPQAVSQYGYMNGYGGAVGNAFQQSQQTIYPAQASNPSGVYPNQSYNQQPPVTPSQYPAGYNPNPYSNPQNHQTPPPAGNQNSQYSQDDNYRY